MMLAHDLKQTLTGLKFGFLEAKFTCITVCVYEGVTERKQFKILPNKVSLSILLHWMAKERSELSKMVMRSSSGKREKRGQIIHCEGNCLYQRKHVKMPKRNNFITWSIDKVT